MLDVFSWWYPCICGTRLVPVWGNRAVWSMCSYVFKGESERFASTNRDLGQRYQAAEHRWHGQYQLISTLHHNSNQCLIGWDWYMVLFACTQSISDISVSSCTIQLMTIRCLMWRTVFRLFSVVALVVGRPSVGQQQHNMLCVDVMSLNPLLSVFLRWRVRRWFCTIW